MEDMKLARININLSQECKEWYQEKARSMGMAMSQLMSYILSTHYENSLNAEAVRLMSSFSKSGDIQEIQKQMIELMTQIKELEEKK